MSNIAECKPYLRDYLERFHNVTNPRRFFNCLNPEHIDNNPSMMFTDKYNICKCFSCGASYDIFDLVGIDYNLDNFRDKIDKVHELYLGYTPRYNDNIKEDKNISYDYTNYYNKCINSINKSDYLINRGITKDLIKKYNIGYDEARNLIVFPINKNCYFARSTVNNNKIKSKGISDIWNKEYIINQEKLIYVTESIIDSLSLEVIDSNVKTISINGIGNINSLVNTIKKYNYDGNIVIVFDNDRPGIEASHKLKEELTKIGVNSFSVTMISNFDNNCKDLNQALQDNRKLLEDNYNYFNDSFKKIIDYKGDELKIG